MSLVYAYFRIPECGGRSFAEIDMLFVSFSNWHAKDTANKQERRIPARKFASTEVDPFDVQLDEEKHHVSHSEYSPDQAAR